MEALLYHHRACVSLELYRSLNKARYKAVQQGHVGDDGNDKVFGESLSCKLSADTNVSQGNYPFAIH